MIMKILVTSYSLSGNTKKIANAICEELDLHGIEVHNKNLAEITPNNFNEFDLIFLGSACHDTDLAKPVKDALQEISDTPIFKMAGFVTHATSMPEGGERNQEMYSQWAGKCSETFYKFSIEKGLDFLGYFHCQGMPSPPIAEFIHDEIIPEDEEWRKYIAESIDHPNDQDLDDARIFARKILLLANGESATASGHDAHA
jgi:flavodoxin